jgi:hypothetical protein
MFRPWSMRRDQKFPAHCICEFEWEPFGLTCVPANCQGVECSGHGACVDEEGAPWCRCDPGFETVGLGCVPADCSGHGACVQSGGALRCVCDPGYQAAGERCVAVAPGGDSGKDVGGGHPQTFDGGYENLQPTNDVVSAPLGDHPSNVRGVGPSYGCFTQRGWRGTVAD